MTSHTPMDAFDVMDMPFSKLVEFIKKHPEDAADLLYQLAEQTAYSDTEEETEVEVDGVYDWRKI